MISLDTAKYPFFEKGDEVGCLTFKAGEKVAEEAMQKYAVILQDSLTRTFYAFVQIPDDGNLKEPVTKLANWIGMLPPEMDTIAKGVLNNLFMIKEGSELPIFAGYPALDDNLVKVDEIDWESFNQVQKAVERVGFSYNDKFLPLDTRANIKAASELLGRYSQEFSGRDRVVFATKIARQAEKLGVSIGDTVIKYASEQLNPDFYELLDIRLKAAENYPETLAVLRDLQQNAPALEVDKIALVMEVIDCMPPFSLKFGEVKTLGSDRPFFSTVYHIPDAYTAVYGKVIIPRTLAEKVAAIPDEKLAERFSPVFISKLREDVAGAMERSTPQVREILRGMINEPPD